MSIDVGRVIAGKYRLVRLIGRGSMGEVWAAHHQSLDERVAVKLLMPPPEGQEEAFESGTVAAARFRNEAQIAARLSRKTRHIVRVTDHGEEEGLAYLVMEMLEGETLDAMLERDRRIPLPLLSNIVGQIARALAQAHADGVAHRDLKPANVFLTQDEDGKLLVKLLDFGIARAIHAHKAPAAFSTAQGLVFGTPSYMSPEQARASGKLDHRCDLWALATIAYEGATGDLPVDGQDTDELLKNLCAGHIVKPGKRQPDLGDRLDPFFDKALAESLVDRFQSAAELAMGFARAVGAPPERDVSSPMLEPTWEEESSPTPIPLRRARARKVAFATCAVLAAGLLGGMTWRALRSPEVTVVPPAAAARIPPPAVSSPVAGTSPVTVPSPDPPVVSLSSLPIAPTRPPTVAPVVPLQPAVNPQPPTPVVTQPAATPAPSPPPPPAPAPAPSATTKKDRSEVF